MAAELFDVGDMVLLTGTFTDLNEIPADPNTVTLKVRDPQGNITEYAEVDMAHPETGTWSYELLLTRGGEWTYRFAGTGGLVAAGEKTILVRRSAF